MNWKLAEQMLFKLTEVYTQDNLRKVTYDREIFPLILRYKNAERSWNLYDSITGLYKILITEVFDEGTNDHPSGGFFMNKTMKPSYEDILQIVGNKANDWSRIFDLLKDYFRLKVSFRFHDATIGWVLEFSRSGKVKMIMAPDKDSFKIGFCFVDRDDFELKKIDDMNSPEQLVHDHLMFSV
jgi:hypothetical protein